MYLGKSILLMSTSTHFVNIVKKKNKRNKNISTCIQNRIAITMFSFDTHDANASHIIDAKIKNTE